jgi:hypothetical protein
VLDYRDLSMRRQFKALRSAHWLPMDGGAKRVRPDHEGTMGSASLSSLALHGHRRTRSAAPCSCLAYLIGFPCTSADPAWRDRSLVFCPAPGNIGVRKSSFCRACNLGSFPPWSVLQNSRNKSRRCLLSKGLRWQVSFSTRCPIRIMTFPTRKCPRESVRRSRVKSEPSRWMSCATGFFPTGGTDAEVLFDEEIDGVRIMTLRHDRRNPRFGLRRK